MIGTIEDLVFLANLIKSYNLTDSIPWLGFATTPTTLEAAFPAASNSGKFATVTTTTGFLWSNRKGLYRSDGISWNRESNATFEILDSESTMSDDVDNTKKMNWQLSGITTGNTRTLTAPDNDYDFDKPSTTYHDFNTGLSNAPYAEGRLFYDDTNKTLAMYNDESDSTLQIGQENWLRLLNNTGSTILNGQLCYISGESGGMPTADLSKADAALTSLSTIAMATHDIENSTVGVFTRLGTVRDLNTSAFSAGDILFLSETTAGGFTDVQPNSPFYSVRIGTVTTSHATTGGVEVDINAAGNTRDVIKIFNGSILEDHSIVSSSDGAIITFTLEKNGGGDLSVFFDGLFTVFDATPAASVTLTAGSDTSPTLNYVYIPKSTGALTSNTTGFPTTEQFVPVATVFAQSAASYQTDGCYKCHAWTDHLSNSVDQGHLQHVNKWIRSQNATWESGTSPTTTVTVNGGAIDNIDFQVTSGIVLQLHSHSFPVINTASSDPVFVINDFTTSYDRITDLGDIDTDSAGVTLRGNNSYYSLVVWGVVSESDADSKLFCNAPSGFYSSTTDAVTDPLGFSNFSIPTEFIGTGFLIARIVIRYRTLSSGTFTEELTEDLRGLLPSTAAGAGGAVSSTDFSDNLFRILNVVDSTKEIALDASVITTGTTRTLTAQDVDGTIQVDNAPINMAAPTELTIATGVVTVTKSYHTIDTQSDDSTDDLDTINGGSAGDILVITANNDARDVVAKDATGNLKLSGDFTMSHSEDTLMLVYNGTNWIEISRSDNTT